jgi:hypothetical protein
MSKGILNQLLAPESGGTAQVANGVILDLHNALEGLGHETNLNDTLHGLTNLGETVGLGRIGADNLITHAIEAVPNILNCGDPIGEVATLVTDAGKVVGAGGNIIQGIGDDVSNPYLVNDVVDGLSSHLPLDCIGVKLPDLGQIALPGCGPGVGEMADTLLGHLLGTSHAGCCSYGGAQDSLVDVHTDGAAVLQVHGDADSLLGLNGNPIL